MGRVPLGSERAADQASARGVCEKIPGDLRSQVLNSGRLR